MTAITTDATRTTSSGERLPWGAFLVWTLAAQAAEPGHVLADCSTPAHQAVVGALQDRKHPHQDEADSPSVTAAVPTAAMLGGPVPWTREPTHNANSGLPVQTTVVTTAMSADESQPLEDSPASGPLCAGPRPPGRRSADRSEPRHAF